MRRYPVDFKTEALNDVEGAYSFLYRNGSEVIAERFRESLSLLVNTLSTQPQLGSPYVGGYFETGKLRRIPVPGFGKWLLFYSFDGKLLTLVRLIHGSRDVGKLLADRD